MLVILLTGLLNILPHPKEKCWYFMPYLLILNKEHFFMIGKFVSQVQFYFSFLFGLIARLFVHIR